MKYCMMRKIASAFLLLAFIAACTDTNDNKYETREIEWISVERDSAEFWDFYTDATFVPLENTLEGMLYHVPKLVAMDNCFYVLDVTESGAEVKKYDNEGHYLCKIGKLGHAKDEYQNLLDFAVNETGDTVVLLTRTSLMAFDSNGKHLFSNAPVNDGFVRRIQGVRGGYLCSTEYSGAEQMLHYVDGDLKLISESLPTMNVTIGVPAIADNPIQQGNGYMYYYDFYASTLYQMRQTDPDVLQAVHFSSKYALSTESFSDVNVYDGKIDHVCEYFVDGDMIVGHVRLTEPSYATPLFIYNVSKGKTALYDSKYYSPRFAAAHGGFHYAIISQDEFMEMRRAMDAGRSCSTFKSNYFDVVGSVNEKSNYVLLMAKPKKGYEK